MSINQKIGLGENQKIDKFRNIINDKLTFYENNLTDYLTSLDWSKPWNAGAQFSGLCVFLETQEKDIDRYPKLKKEMSKDT